MNLTPGQMVLVRFPFSDITSSKQRPGLLLSQVSLTQTVALSLIAMITSRVAPPEISGDILLLDWKEEGLLHPSKLRLAKLATVDSSLVRKVLGHVSDRDRQVISKSLKELFGFWR